ncbi:MAG: TFIID-domain-containing protein [Olpidium bornovanus]|uniref:TFIID-domain-containing protein n=1 Tax=Olpidium bornovanus TaxID=278681 RepID=A0A8H8A0V9_9FUNG|nr:MAG: TFIID-domain-containing protein [Olpidium bornovanus]
MMFVFGEVSDPALDTVNLIEDIVRSQVVEIIIQGAAQAHRQSSRHLSAEDLIFLIRHDKAKCNRLRTYLSWKDVRKNVKEASKNDATEEMIEAEGILGEPSSGEKTMKMRKKTVKLSWDLFAGFLDVLNDDDNEEDEDELEAYRDTMQRLKDADEITRKMTKEEYVHYSECRQASFTYRKAKKFKEWANLAAYLDVKPNDDIIDILGFLTFEMVSTLTCSALGVKRAEEAAATAAAEEGCNEEKTDGISSRKAVGGGRCGGGEPADLRSLFEAVPTAQATTDSLFAAAPKGQAPLQPQHVHEGYRLLQGCTKTIGNTFSGGLKRTRVALI